jgi:hypothetical protein
MADADLLDDLIAKLHEMQEQLSMAQLETIPDSLLAGRIRHLTILALYTRIALEKMKESAGLPPGSATSKPPSDPPRGS